MVLKPEKEAEARAIFEKWDLDFAIVGETIPEDRFLIIHGNDTKADLPLSKLSSSAPEYDRPYISKAEYRAWVGTKPLENVPYEAPYRRRMLRVHARRAVEAMVAAG